MVYEIDQREFNKKSFNQLKIKIMKHVLKINKMLIASLLLVCLFTNCKKNELIRIPRNDTAHRRRCKQGNINF